MRELCSAICSRILNEEDTFHIDCFVFAKRHHTAILAPIEIVYADTVVDGIDGVSQFVLEFCQLSFCQNTLKHRILNSLTIVHAEASHLSEATLAGRRVGLYIVCDKYIHKLPD